MIDELVAVVIDALNASGVRYMITGSLASNVFGISRMTKDADFVLQFTGNEAVEIARLLQSHFTLDPQMAFETITGTQKQVLHHIGSAFVVELFALSGDAHDQARFFRRTEVRLLNRTTWLPTPEDIIIQKLRWSCGGARGKDIDDARNVLHVQHDRLDWAYLTDWCARHGTIDQLQDLRRGLSSRP